MLSGMSCHWICWYFPGKVFLGNLQDFMILTFQIKAGMAAASASQAER